MTTITPQHLERLRRYDTPTVCNLIELFDIRPRNAGYMDGRIQACFPDLPPMVGFAATATFRATAPASGSAYAALEGQVERFAELSGPAVVVFQDLDSPTAAATFGEVMCTVYQAFGAAGIITSGAGRDLDQVRAIGFPAFTGGTICSHGYTHILDLHTPVHVGGVMVRPDDLLHGDRNGVTTVPREIVAELLDIADAFVAAEQVVLDAMRASAPTPARLREARAESKARIAQLQAQVSRRR
ncbi:MAG TPA: RraA family protein [Roseiflexaceae bacterium]|nr:RraA family protein [Roseiflexaceae bacterium]